MTSDVTVTSAATQSQQTQDQGLQLAEDFNEFLNLLTLQLQNQDPLDPMDSTEFTNQIVQFTQVEQAINTNSKLDDLISLELSTIASSALGYVGLDVSYISSEFPFNGNETKTINYALAQDAKSALISIMDESGEVVFSQNGPTDVGQNIFEWDGRDDRGQPVEPGTYNVRIDALDFDDEGISVSTVVEGNVRGIEVQNGVIFLLVGDRAVSVGNVINASVPETPPQNTDPDNGDTDNGDTDA